jgi:hypothetical protein
MKVLALVLTAVTGGTIALACDKPDETLVVYVEPNTDASAPALLVADDTDKDIPCAPRHVLQTICQQCHTRPMRNGAPFPLQTRSDIVVHTYGGVVVRELMIEEVTAGRMPLTPVTISDEYTATLLYWLAAGAPADPDEDCDIPDANTEDAE